MSTTSRRITVGNTVVAEYEGDNLVIVARVSNRRRTYTFSPSGDGGRLTVTLDGVTQEIPLPRARRAAA